MRTVLSCLLIPGLLLAAPAMAQERTAGQANDAQVNWSALRTGIDKVDTQNKALSASFTALNTLVNKLLNCNQQQMFYNGTKCVGPVLGSDTLKTYAFAINANNTSGSKTYTVPAGASTALLTITCKARGSNAIVQLTADFPGTGYPVYNVCTIGGILDDQTNTFGYSKILNVPAKAKQLRISYGSTHEEHHSPQNVGITFIGTK